MTSCQESFQQSFLEIKECHFSILGTGREEFAILCRLREHVFSCIFWFTIIFCDKDLGNIGQEIFSLQILMIWVSLQLSFIQILIQGCQWLLCCLLDLGEFYLLGELYSWFLSWWLFVYIFWLEERRYFTFTDILIHCSKFLYHSLVFHFF